MSKYRMYSLVLKQLSPIQKGVQMGHSIAEYGNLCNQSSDYIQWVNVDKTIIMLDGGTYPEMKESMDFLMNIRIPFAAFYEEDLGGLLTSISFIVDDRIYDTKLYPSYEEELTDDVMTASESPTWLIEMGGTESLRLRNFIFSKRLAM